MDTSEGINLLEKRKLLKTTSTLSVRLFGCPETSHLEESIKSDRSHALASSVARAPWRLRTSRALSRRTYTCYRLKTLQTGNLHSPLLGQG